MKKKKKVEDMTEEEVREELKRLGAELEKSLPELESKFSDIVGRNLQIARSFYHIWKDERQRKQLIELLRTDKSFRRDLLGMAEGLENLKTELWQTEDLARQLEELTKKRKK